MSFLLYLLLSLPLMGAYAMLAIGIVVVFRASKVLNLAHGAMSVVPAYAVYELHRRGIPVGVAVALGVLIGALFGALVERFFVRPLARQGPTAQTVGTIAVYGVAIAAVAQIWGSGSVAAPSVFPEGAVHFAGAELRWGQLGLFVVSLLATGAFYALFRFTRMGLALRGAAENPTAAALMGINPERMARVAWMLGGGLAGFAGILLAAVTNLQPYSLSLQMLPAFVAALIGGFFGLGGALAGALVVGAAQGMVPAFGSVPGLGSLASQVGMPQLVLTILAIVVMYRRGSKFSAGSNEAGLVAITDDRPRISTFRMTPYAEVDGRRRILRYVVLALLVAWPAIGIPSFLDPLDTFTVLGDSILAGQYFIAAASIVLLTGWAGQISLAQGAFVGISAFGSALLSRKLGVGFPVSLIFGAALSAAASAALGVVALRVRGLYLAVATLIFAWMADEYLFVVPWFAGKGGSASARTEPVGVKGGWPYFDFTDRRAFYYVTLAVAAAVLFGLLNLRDSKMGRAFTAVRGSEIAAASLGIDVTRQKLIAFATAGFVAGLGGGLVLAHQVTIVPEQFSLRVSLLFLAIAVVGGLRSLGGAVAGAIVFAALSELFFRVPSLGQYLQLVSALLLAVILLLYPKGLAGLASTVTAWRSTLRGIGDRESLRPIIDRFRHDYAELRASASGLRRSLAPRFAALRRFPAARRRAGSFPRPGLTGVVVSTETLDRSMQATGVGDDVDVDVDVVGARFRARPGHHNGIVAIRNIPADNGDPVLEGRNITVRFGGLTAVEGASLMVRAGQITGLIGPNGAGKTTLFNALSGLNEPTEGSVHLFGEDVTPLPVHERARRGMARTFQVIQLFPDLTVFENLLIATSAHGASGLLASVFVTRGVVLSQLAAEETSRNVIRFLDLDDIADRPVAGLPFGTLRMVEIGRALVTGAPVVMLDEPASGLDNRETDHLGEVLLYVRDELGISILLIEHDIRMVTAVTDHLYVLNRGRILREGSPLEIQRSPEVIAAYLGKTAEGVS